MKNQNKKYATASFECLKQVSGYNRGNGATEEKNL